MFRYIIYVIASVHLVVATQVQITKTHNKDRPRNKNYKQLLEFIQLLNTQNEKQVEDLNNPKFIKDLDNKGKINLYKKSIGKKINENLQSILRIVQKNYDANENIKGRKSRDDPNIMFISNPEVIEEYKTEFNNTDTLQAYNNQIERKVQRSSFVNSVSLESLSEEFADEKRNLKDILQDLRKTELSPLSESRELLILRRRNQKIFPKRESAKDYSIEKAVWKEDTEKEKPKKKKDSSNTFDTNQYTSKNKKDFGPRKYPAGFQSKSKMKFDSYKPKKESYSKRREDYRPYGRTPIPIVGKKSVYDKK